MGDQSKIQWTEATWNPVRGCSRVSEGCVNCYAERQAARFSGGPRVDGGQVVIREAGPYVGFAESTVAGPRWTGRVELIPSMLDLPIRWRRPRMVFVNSMSDMFHPKLSNEDIATIFGVMALAPQHTFQTLTKHADRMARWFEYLLEQGFGWLNASLKERGIQRVAIPTHGDGMVPGGWPLPNVWLGTSVESAKHTDRVRHLLSCPAAVRWVSYEPALGPVGWNDYLSKNGKVFHQGGYTDALSWIVVGGESGPDARPCDIAWVRSTVDACRSTNTPVFVKQLGARTMFSDGEIPDGLWTVYDANGHDHGDIEKWGREGGLRWSHPKGGDPEEWPKDIRVREYPRT